MAQQISFDFRLRLVEENDQLSDDDRKKLHFLFHRIVPCSIRDDQTLGGTLLLFENLLDQALVSETEFDILIRAFDGIGNRYGAQRLREHQRLFRQKLKQGSEENLETKSQDPPASVRMLDIIEDNYEQDTMPSCDDTLPLQRLIEDRRSDSNGIFQDGKVHDENICLLAAESQGNTYKWYTLNLWNNNIGPKGASYINQILLNSRLTYLHLGTNKLGSQGLVQLTALDKNPHLTELDLWHNEIDDEGIKVFAPLLPTTVLRKLNLGANSIGDEGCRILFDNLPSSLINLNLYANNISENCLPSILTAIGKSKLQELNIQHQHGRRWSQKSREELKRVGQDNSCDITI